MAFRVTVDGRVHDIDILRRRPHLVVAIDGREHEVSAPGAFGDGRQTIEIAGVVAHFARAQCGDRQLVRLGGRNFEARIVDPRDAAGAAGAGHDDVRAPMPGVVVTIHRAAGDAVARGEPLVTIESMKLQMALAAPRDGVLAALLRAEGERFEKDEVIARLAPVAGEG
jgi:3-methylcrotonyl-CoA carboxylase alpha subunit